MNKEQNKTQVAVTIEKLKKLFEEYNLKLEVIEEPNSTTNYVKIMKK